jgi:hypothetical protein
MALRAEATYGRFQAYSRAVRELERAVGAVSGGRAGLADYRDPERLPTRRADLLAEADSWEQSPYAALYRELVTEALESSPHDEIGVSISYLSQALPAFALLGYLRAAYPGRRVVAGGGLVNSWLGQGLVGSGETFGGLVDALAPGRGEEALSARYGLAALPAAPRFDGFDWASYAAPYRVLPYNFSWSCPYKKCAFCPEAAEGYPYRAVKPELALEELRGLCERWEPGLIHFTDSEIAPPYLRALAAGGPWPEGRPVPWYGFARFGEELADHAFCRALAASGCAMLQLGLESGSQVVLDAMGKGTRLAHAEAALKALSDAGIATYVYLLFGTPAEGRDEALATRDFVARMAGHIGFINAAVFNLPASSALAAGLTTRPFNEGDLSLYRDFAHPMGWDRARVRAFLKEDFGSEPAIAAILARTPPVYTSSHAPIIRAAESPTAP